MDDLQTDESEDSTQAERDSNRTRFEEVETRREDMRESLEVWVEQFTDRSEEARASESFREWLDVQSRFHDYSYRNTLLIKQQCPDATKVAGYRTWQEEFDRSVRSGESAIWIWAPIVTSRCPECGNSASYHDQSDCEYDDAPPEDWERSLVGFKPVPVFDVSQTDGEPLPALDTDAHADGDVSELVHALLDASSALGVRAGLVPPEEWAHGDAAGICTDRDTDDRSLSVEVKSVENEAAVASVLAHEYAHALLHFDGEDPGERRKREVEAESVAYVVSRYFGLDASNSAFYVAAWSGEPADAIRERLQRIVETAREIIEIVENAS